MAAARLGVLLPRLLVVVAVFLLGTATLTFAAGTKIAAQPVTASTTAVAPTLLVPDVEHQAYVFAKGILQDAGFAWRVDGPVHGYAANVVVSQEPAPGTRVVDTGAPLIVLRLSANPKYQPVGTPDDRAPYKATRIEMPAATTTAATLTKPAPTTTVATTATTTTTAATTTVAKPKPKPKPAARPVAFVVPGARKEPLDEIPLTERAKNLGTWLTAHPKPTNENVRYWLYQNSWIVTGARFGWWHGADALRTLIAADARAQAQWGIGDRSESVARAALAYVESQSK